MALNLSLEFKPGFTRHHERISSHHSSCAIHSQLVCCLPKYI